MKNGLKLRRAKRITTSIAPILSPWHTTINPRKWPCCSCCVEHWRPADCATAPHHEPCPQCQATQLADGEPLPCGCVPPCEGHHEGDAA